MPRRSDEKVSPKQHKERKNKQKEVHGSEEVAKASNGKKWHNCLVRAILSMVMIAFFLFIVRKGAAWLMATVFLIQFTCFYEIIKIGQAVYQLYDFPWFRALSWYFLVASNYFFFGESLIDYWSTVLQKDEFLHYLVVHHRFISFALYITGFVWFVLSLQKGFYVRQFSLFAWTHVTLLLIVSQSFLILQNLLQGLIWLLIPTTMVICCDIMSYVFGSLFGKTPLIQLSPNKTWEGFIGGAISTIVFGLIASSVLMRDPFFVCPVESYFEESANCTVPPAFQLMEYNAPRPLAFVMRILKLEPVIRVRPFLAHTIVFGLFASLLGPFGGFFASGFKRAFKIKDFGVIIPGHGGLMDRFDCQLLMGTFVNAYISSFIRVPNAKKIIQQVMLLSPEEQLLIYNRLQEQLVAIGILGE